MEEAAQNQEIKRSSPFSPPQDPSDPLGFRGKLFDDPHFSSEYTRNSLASSGPIPTVGPSSRLRNNLDVSTLEKIAPWGMRPLPKWVGDALRKRATEYNIQFSENNNPSEKKGPRTAWCRFFSNGINEYDEKARNLEGFSMGGASNAGFDQSHAFDRNGKSIIGIDARGIPHRLTDAGRTGAFNAGSNLNFTPNDFPHRPPPGVYSIETELQGGGGGKGMFGALRKITVRWKCFSLNQLEYLTPYFLTPGISVVVEWGWNNYNTKSLCTLAKDELINVFSGRGVHKKLEDSEGNYDIAMGYISSFQYSIDEGGIYDCTTEILSGNNIFNGTSITDETRTQQTIDKAKSTSQIRTDSDSIDKRGITFYEYIERELSNIEPTKTNILTVDASKFGAKTDKKVYINNINQKVFSPMRKAGKNSSPFLTKYNSESWIRMDLVKDLINSFFSVNLDESTIINNLFLEDIMVSAHPALKSMDPDVLFPNKICPRFTIKRSAQKETSETGVLDEVERRVRQNTRLLSPTRSPFMPPAMADERRVLQENADFKNGLNQEYRSLFEKTIQEFNAQDIAIDFSYDDLKSIINPDGRSFPAFEPKTTEYGSVPSGYWGYLDDVFISMKMFKEVVTQNYTLKRIIEVILQKINTASGGTMELKLEPPEYSNQFYYIRDNNFTFVRNPEHTANLVRIQLGSVQSAYIKTAQFQANISSAMFNEIVGRVYKNNNQTPLQNLVSNNTHVNVDSDGLGNVAASQFNGKDRLFQRPAKQNTSLPGTTQDQVKNIKQRRSEDNTNFVYFKDLAGTNYILYEPDREFLLSIIRNPKDSKALYLNNLPLPGVTLKLELAGMSGFTYLAQFVIDHAPRPYSYEASVWTITGVSNRIENKNWTTVITAEVRPLTILKRPLPTSDTTSIATGLV